MHLTIIRLFKKVYYLGLLPSEEATYQATSDWLQYWSPHKQLNLHNFSFRIHNKCPQGRI